MGKTYLVKADINYNRKKAGLKPIKSRYGIVGKNPARPIKTFNKISSVRKYLKRHR